MNFNKQNLPSKLRLKRKEVRIPEISFASALRESMDAAAPAMT
jgi:hypothetical protein